MKFNFTPSCTDDNLIEMYKILRKDHPVFWSEEHNCWIISRYSDVVKGLADYKLFTYENIDSLVGRDLLALTSHTDSSNFSIDLPPEYPRKRKAIMDIYYSGISDNLDKKIYNNIEMLFNNVKNKNIDAIKNITNYIPIFTICEITGYNYEYREDILNIVSKLWERNDVHTRIKLCKEAYKYLISNQPSTLKNNKYEKEDVISFIIGLFLGGSNSLTGTLPSLLYHTKIYKNEFEKTFNSEQMQHKFIQESLRHTLVQSHLIRTASRDVQMYNKKINKDDRVAFMIGSANFDEKKFGKNVDLFYINRNFNKLNLVFGHGMYRCMGHLVGELQLKMFLEFIINNKNNIEIYDYSFKEERNFTGTLIKEILIKYT